MLVARVVARRVGVPDSPGQDAAAAIAEQVGDGSMLLVLTVATSLLLRRAGDREPPADRLRGLRMGPARAVDVGAEDRRRRDLSGLAFLHREPGDGRPCDGENQRVLHTRTSQILRR